MTISKNTERSIMEQVSALIMPHSSHLDTYGLQACLDLCQAWARALDTDMPMECFQRDREASRHEAKANSEACQRCIDKAQAEANRIVKAAEDKATRIAAIMRDRVYQAVKATEAI